MAGYVHSQRAPSATHEELRANFSCVAGRINNGKKKPLKKIFFFYCLSKSAGWRIGKIIKKQSKSYFNCARLGANLARPPPLNMGANGYSVSLLDSQTIVIETRPKNAQLVLTAHAFVPRRAALCTKDVEHSRADNTSCAAAERRKKNCWTKKIIESNNVWNEINEPILI